VYIYSFSENVLIHLALTPKKNFDKKFSTSESMTTAVVSNCLILVRSSTHTTASKLQKSVQKAYVQYSGSS
jgi:hypothetical protein